jgi:hypothetical protein
MTPRPRHTLPPSKFAALLALMDRWPKSWAGIAKDEAVGAELTALMRSFFLHLQQHNFSAKTLRRHLDNLWLIGGEIIHELHVDAPLRKKPARTLLLRAVDDGDAFVGGLSDQQQSSLSATARKLFRFLSAPTQ